MSSQNKIYSIIKLFVLVVAGLTIGVIGVVVFQRWQSSPVTYGDYSSRFHDPAETLILYGTSWCPACKATRKFLAERKIKYIDVDIEKSPQATKEYSALGKNAIPVLLFRDRTIVGFESKLITDALEKH